MKPKNIEDIYPLSPMQQGMLFHSLYAPDSGVYIEQLTCELQGKLNVAAFEQAWQAVINRHSVLRTAFVWETPDKPLQVVGEKVNLPLEHYDWRGLSPNEQQKQLKTLLQSQKQRGFQLSKAPLINITLIQLTEDLYQFIWSFHHLLLDGWSLPLVFKEAIAFYNAFCEREVLSFPKPQLYRDYIAWLQQQNIADAKRFWQEKLKGFHTPTPLIDNSAPTLNSTTKNTDNQSLTPKYDEHQINLSATLTSALQALARQEKLTLNTLVQAAWALLLSRYSGEKDILYGATVCGRPPELAGADSIIGLFINTLPVRVSLNDHQELLTWLQNLQAQQFEARQYEYTPLFEIQKWSEVPANSALFESIVVFENYPLDAALQNLNELLEIQNLQYFSQTNYPLTLTVIPGAELVLKIAYDCDRFHADTIARMLGHLQTLLAGMIATPHTRLSDLPLLTEAERHQLLVEFNQPKFSFSASSFEIPQSVMQLFEAQVAKTPDAIAAVFDHQQITYEQLNVKANQLAHYLQKLGVKPEAKVGIFLERSLDLIVAILGVLKAGGAYVPLDPAYPQERLSFMVKDAGITQLITQTSLKNSLNFLSDQVIYLDALTDILLQENCENLPHQVTAQNLIYIIYTSGSTGQPKGVAIEQGSLVNAYLAWESAYQLRTQASSHLQMASFSFDVFSGDLVRALCSGGKLVLCPRDFLLEPQQLYQLMVQEKIDFAEFVPAVLRNLIDYLEDTNQRLDFLKILVCGSDKWYVNEHQKTQQFCNSKTRIINSFGVTEATIDSCYFETKNLNLAADQLVPIGQPFTNTQLYILNANLEPVPIGVTGELYIGGAGLARGYLNRPELTDEKFIANPFSSKLSDRLYKTGDQARYLPDGNIQFLGRCDQQVKIRGYRIELGEIETALNQHPTILQSVVIPRDRALIAYLVPQSKFTPETGAINPKIIPNPHHLRDFLKDKLPNYMIPSAFVFLEALPLTPNGKIDRRSLPEPEQSLNASADSSHSFRAPTAEILTSIWSQVLQVNFIKLQDNFFDLGGHSLLATQAISRIRKTFAIDLPLRFLFEYPTIAELAHKIDATIQANQLLRIPSLQPVLRTEKLPLSFAQQRLWFIAQLHPENSSYNVPAAVRLQGVLNLAALQQSLNELIQRHEVLRTTFTAIDGEPFQVIHPTVHLKISLVDFPNSQESELQNFMIQESNQPFDLANGPLLRVTLINLADQDAVLLLTMHHIIADGWSMGVLIDEIARLYAAFSQSKPSPLTPLSIQYADFAAWQQQWLKGDVLDTQLNYWKSQLSANLPELKLPSDRPRDQSITQHGARQNFQLSKPVSEQLKALSRSCNVTLFMSLVAAFNCLLYCYTEQEDIVIGTDVANRNQPEIENLIGFFVNQLVLRTNLSGNPTFKTLLTRVRTLTLKAYAHQDLPFEKLVEALNPQRSFNRNPLFDVKLVLQNTPTPPVNLPGLTLTPLEVNKGSASFDLLLNLMETEAGIIGTCEYRVDLYDAARIHRMLTHFEKVLIHILEQPDIQLSTLAKLIKEAEKAEQIEQAASHQKTLQRKLSSIKRKSIAQSDRA